MLSTGGLKRHRYVRISGDIRLPTCQMCANSAKRGWSKKDCEFDRKKAEALERHSATVENDLDALKQLDWL